MKQDSTGQATINVLAFFKEHLAVFWFLGLNLPMSPARRFSADADHITRYRILIPVHYEVFAVA
jgi:hypothetical protein